MSKYLKRLATFLASTVFILALASGAQAQTNAQARAKAIKEQMSDCRGSNPFLYTCQNPLLLAPSCHDTGIDRPGQPQHICGGIFTRKGRILRARKPICVTTYALSPWGAVINYPTYTCYSGLPA